nr:kinesin-like protein KIF6 [Odocoileus virginianus texanus]
MLSPADNSLRLRAQSPPETVCPTSSLFTSTLDCEAKRRQILIPMKESDLSPVTGRLKEEITQRHVQQVALGRLKEEITQRHVQQVALGISENIPVPSVPDQLEEKLRSQLEEEKRRYKTMFARLKALKVEIEHLQLLMDKAKVKLQKEFEAWWAEEATSLQVNSPAVTASNHMKPFPQMSEAQHERSQPLSNKSIPERPVSSVPLTGDSQTDSDILAFIKARQNILQRTGFQ